MILYMGVLVERFLLAASYATPHKPHAYPRSTMRQAGFNAVQWCGDRAVSPRRFIAWPTPKQLLEAPHRYRVRVSATLMREEPANALEARLRRPQRFLGMKSPTVPAYSGSFGLGMSDGPTPVAAFWITMKPKPNMARRACLISRSRMLSPM